MKDRLNLTIDRELLASMKVYAASKEMSVSELVEAYFRGVTRPLNRRNILDLVEELATPAIIIDREDQPSGGQKHGL